MTVGQAYANTETYTGHCQATLIEFLFSKIVKG